MKAAHDAAIAKRRLTRSMVEKPAHQRTFETAELLENIIVHLPARTILADMLRVSRFWRNVINASPAIQTKLWRRPLSDRVSSPVGLADRYSIYYNFSVRQITSDVPMCSGSYQINAVFPEAPGPLHRYESMTHVRFDVEPVCLDKTTQKKDLVQVVMARHEPSEESSETPSWLDMHVSEPPITTAWIEVWVLTELAELASTRHYSEDRAPHLGLTAIQATVRDSGGVTYGMVRDAVDKILAQPYHPHVVRDRSPAAIRICFVVDTAEISLPTMPGRKKFTVRRGGRRGMLASRLPRAPVRW